MRTNGKMHGFWNREFLFGATLLTLYALALFLPDPEWVTWAGAMAVGALPQEMPPSLPYTPTELFAGAGTLAIMGLVAFAVLALFLGGNMRGRVFSLWEREIVRWWHGGVPRRP